MGLFNIICVVLSTDIKFSELKGYSKSLIEHIFSVVRLFSLF